MSDLLSEVLPAMRADQARLEYAALNSANATTPGYRRSALSQVQFAHVMASQATSQPSQATVVMQHGLDLTPAQLKQTSQPLDVALDGQGFLVLSDGNHHWLTRTASFHVDEHGDLVGPRGLHAVGAQGPIHIGESVQGLSINSVGELTRGDQVLGRFKAVMPTDVEALSSSDGVLFEAAPENMQDAPADKLAIRSGFLEGSNSNPVQEMLDVMQSTRHFESMLRAAQGYDEVLGKAIEKLGAV